MHRLGELRENAPESQDGGHWIALIQFAKSIINLPDLINSSLKKKWAMIAEYLNHILSESILQIHTVMVITQYSDTFSVRLFGSRLTALWE